MKGSFHIGLLLFLAAWPARAAILYTETFDSGANGWADTGNGMTASYNGDGYMQGVFAAQGLFPIPQTDSFKISSGTNFLGSYNALTAFTFDLYAENVLPSDLALRVWRGTNVYFYAQSLSLMNAGEWTTFTVPLTYSAGWQDGGEVGFLYTLDNVSRVDVQLTRNGTGEQTFYLDNFGTLDTGIDPGGGGGDGENGSMVPEPSTGLMVLFFGAGLFAIRKHWRQAVEHVGDRA